MLTAAGVRPIHLYAIFPKGNLYAQFPMPCFGCHAWHVGVTLGGCHAWWEPTRLTCYWYLHLLILYFSSQAQTVNTEGVLLSLTLGLWMSSREPGPGIWFNFDIDYGFGRCILGLENSKCFMIVGLDIGKSLFLDLENFTSFVDLMSSCGTSSPADDRRPTICIPTFDLINFNFFVNWRRAKTIACSWIPFFVCVQFWPMSCGISSPADIVDLWLLAVLKSCRLERCLFSFNSIPI